MKLAVAGLLGALAVGALAQEQRRPLENTRYKIAHQNRDKILKALEAQEEATAVSPEEHSKTSVSPSIPLGIGLTQGNSEKAINLDNILKPHAQQWRKEEWGKEEVEGDDGRVRRYLKGGPSMDYDSNGAFTLKSLKGILPEMTSQLESWGGPAEVEATLKAIQDSSEQGKNDASP